MAAQITVTCPHCSNRMLASVEHVGRQGRCSRCRSLVDIHPSEKSTSLDLLHPDNRAHAWSLTGSLGTTDIAGWKSGLLGTALATVLYAAVFFPLRESALGQLFISRGPIPPIATFVTCWGVGILVLKTLAVRRQVSYAERELELLPLKLGLQITPDNADQFIDHFSRLPNAQRESILGRRIQGAIDHFRSRRSVPEVQQYLAAQAEIDASQVDSGYTILRSFIWAVPIMGFIGTVMGISQAVTGLDVSFTDDTVASELSDGMRQVTAGLATAFDTTFLALIMAILLLFPTETLRKKEYGMLDRIESFANETLLRRMSDKDEPNEDELPEIVRDALEAAFQEHQRWLAQWQIQVATLGAKIGADFETAIKGIQESVVDFDKSRVADLTEVSKLCDEIVRRTNELSSNRLISDEHLARQCEQFVRFGEEMQHVLERNIERYREILQLQAVLFDDSAFAHRADHLKMSNSTRNRSVTTDDATQEYVVHTEGSRSGDVDGTEPPQEMGAEATVVETKEAVENRSDGTATT